MKVDRKAEQVYRAMMAEKTGEERMIMGFSMLNFARRIVLSSIGKDVSPGEQRRKLFLRFYRNDFDRKELDKILKHLEQGPARKPDSIHTDIF
jgi:hypothetical protein